MKEKLKILANVADEKTAKKIVEILLEISNHGETVLSLDGEESELIDQFLKY